MSDNSWIDSLVEEGWTWTSQRERDLAKKTILTEIEHIIGEDEDRSHRYNRNFQAEIDGRNHLRMEQRQRAGITPQDKTGSKEVFEQD